MECSFSALLFSSHVKPVNDRGKKRVMWLKLSFGVALCQWEKRPDLTRGSIPVSSCCYGVMFISEAFCGRGHGCGVWHTGISALSRHELLALPQPPVLGMGPVLVLL